MIAPSVWEKGDRLVVGVSGGKDSGALCLWLMEQGLGPDDYDRVFCDTGWELPEVYDYLRGPLTDKVGPITELRPAIELDERREAIACEFEERLGHYSAMVRLVLSKGMFPSRRIRFCTQELKASLVAKHYAGCDFEPINTIGIRADESAARSQAAEWEWSDLLDCYTWRPLLDWTWADVISIHVRHNFQPAPPYLVGASRVGCAPCIMARKSEIEWLADYFPARMEMLGELERAISWMAAERGAEKFRTWFQDPNPPRDKKGVKHNRTWPIDRVVEWSRGAVGQEELFAGRKEDHGCMRWGFCDTGKGGAP